MFTAGRRAARKLGNLGDEAVYFSRTERCNPILSTRAIRKAETADVVRAFARRERAAFIEDFPEGFNQPITRGIRIGSKQRVATYLSRHGWSGDCLPSTWRGDHAG